MGRMLYACIVQWLEGIKILHQDSRNAALAGHWRSVRMSYLTLFADLSWGIIGQQIPKTLFPNIRWLTQCKSWFFFPSVMFFRGISKSMLSNPMVNPGWQFLRWSFILSFISCAVPWFWSSLVFRFSLVIFSLAFWSGWSKPSPRASSLAKTHLFEQVILSFA